MKEYAVGLTQDEAMGLLDLLVLCPNDLSPEQRSAIEKLSSLCRGIIRETAHSVATVLTDPPIENNAVCATEI